MIVGHIDFHKLLLVPVFAGVGSIIAFWTRRVRMTPEPDTEEPKKNPRRTQEEPKSRKSNEG